MIQIPGCEEWQLTRLHVVIVARMIEAQDAFWRPLYVTSCNRRSFGREPTKVSSCCGTVNSSFGMEFMRAHRLTFHFQIKSIGHW